MLRFYKLLVVLAPSLVTHGTGCTDSGQGRAHQGGVTGVVAGSGVSNQADMPSVAEALPRGGSSGPVSAAAQGGQMPMDLPDSSTKGSPSQSAPVDAPPA